VGAARDQNVPNHAAYPSARHQYAGALAPDLVQLPHKRLVVVTSAELRATGIRGIGLQIEIGRGRDDEVNRPVAYHVPVAGVTQHHLVARLIVGGGPSGSPQPPVRLQQFGDSSGSVIGKRERGGAYAVRI